MAVEFQLDVSALEPPEPLVRTIAVAMGLEAGQFLRMRHRREPCLLRANLEERGYRCIIGQVGDAAWEALIWRHEDDEAAAAAQAAGEALAGS